MSIEFACQACAKLLRVADGSNARSFRCPACGHLQAIPQRPRGTSSLHGPTSAPSTATAPLKILCPQCQFELQCSRTLLGTKGQCRNCQHIFTIAEKTSPTNGDRLASKLGWVFHCPACQQLFAGEAEMEGRKGKCHACGEVFTIELKSAGEVTPAQPAVTTSQPARVQVSPTASTATGPVALSPQLGGAQLSKPEDAISRGPTSAKLNCVPASSSAAPIQFACTQCAGLMEVPGSTAGQSTACPYCGQVLTIPASSASGLVAKAMTPSPILPPRRPSASAAPAPPGKAVQDVWADLGDLSRIGSSNPYAAPRTNVNADIGSTSPWGAAPDAGRVSGLSFGNAFRLTFDSLFPYCLVAAGLFTAVACVGFALLMAQGFVLGFVFSTMGLDPGSTSARLLLMGSISVVMFMLLLIATAVYCMTCNTALHAVRKKKITASVLFSTGPCYGGMLVIMLGWTGFNLARAYGVPLLTRAIAEGGHPQVAATVGIAIILVLAIVQILLTLLLASVPFAMLDGEDLLGALRTSSTIFLRNFLTILAISICGGLLYALVGVLSCGVGLIALVASIVYLNAAIYRLAVR